MVWTAPTANFNPDYAVGRGIRDDFMDQPVEIRGTAQRLTCGAVQGNEAREGAVGLHTDGQPVVVLELLERFAAYRAFEVQVEMGVGETLKVAGGVRRGKSPLCAGCIRSREPVARFAIPLLLTNRAGVLAGRNTRGKQRRTPTGSGAGANYLRYRSSGGAHKACPAAKASICAFGPRDVVVHGLPLAAVKMNLRGVILDVDGTLVDSNLAHARAWHAVLSEAGYNVTVEQLERMIGMGGDKLLPAAIGVEKDSPEGKRLSEERNALFTRKYLPELKPTRGARELLEHLRGDGHQLVVASSAESKELRALLDIVGAAELVEDTTTSSDVAESKPDPDVVHSAIKKLGVPADRAVMLGDTPYDVEAATRAGVRIIAVRSGGWSDAELRGAVAVFKDPADLLAHYAETVFAKAQSG